MISGLQKMTLLDYPGKIACTVFLQGCNFRCPFCHNSDLLPHGGQPYMDVPGFLAFLQKRRGLLDAVCVSGGEPTGQPGLEDLLKQIKAMGFLVKLDTNGSRPEVLKGLVNQGLVDYVAMDVKNSPSRYAETVGLPKVDLEKLSESLRFLLSGAVDYELRTTVVEEFHDEASILEMGQWLCSLDFPKKPAKIFLQSFVDRESVLRSGLHAPHPRTLEKYVELLSAISLPVSLRGV